MKFYHWAASAVCLLFMAVGCHEAPIGDDFVDKHYSPKGSLIKAEDVAPGFFDLADPDNAMVGFTLVNAGETASSANVTATHSGTGASATLTDVTSFPTEVTITLDEMLTALGLSIDDVNIGETVVFSFESSSGGNTFISSEPLVADFNCASDFAGTCDYTSSNYFCSGDNLTGTVEITESGAGKYVFDDWSFGTYDECYGGPAASYGSLQLVDVCNEISVSGADNYGDTWEFNIQSIDGTKMVAKWSNTYGETGTVELVRQDGRDWPPLSN